MRSKCSVCTAEIETDEAAILTMGGFATPRYICAECESDMDSASGSADVDVIFAAMERVSKKMTSNNIDDGAVLKTVEEIMKAASERAEMIRNGEYDFSEDDSEEFAEGEDEIPEELRETDEDRELDRKEAEANKRADKITNWVCIALIAAAVGYLVYRVVTTYFL